MNEKLQEIGNKLNVSKQDLGNIEKERIKGKFVYPIIGAVIVVCSTILGFFMGKANAGCTNCEGYPYGVAGAISSGVASKKKRFFLTAAIITVLLSVIGFATAYIAGQNMFAYAIMYNVYKRGNKR